MTLLSVCQDVCKVIGLDPVPSAVASNTDREYVELLHVANEMAKRISRGHDWQKLSAIQTMTGDGTTEDFDLPSDYDRMLVKAQVWSSDLETALSPISDLDKWLEMDVQSFDFVINAWTLYGGQMHIKPALTSGITAKYFYQSSNIVLDVGQTPKALFTADDDTFRLDEQVLKLGMIWQWRANKGLPYDEDMMNYEQALEREVLRDKGSRMLRVGTIRMPRDVRIAYPQAIQG
jgi:hypothetical protein